MTEKGNAEKLLLRVAQAAIDDFMASDEGQAYFGDTLAGMGMLRVTEDGKIQRVAPKDFDPPSPDKLGA